MIAVLFGRAPVDRAVYLTWGVALTILKYAVEAAFVGLQYDAFFTPLEFLIPRIEQRNEMLGGDAGGVALAWFVWTIPFVWVAVWMSAKRAIDASVSPAISLAIFVPVINFAVMAYLAVKPGVPTDADSLDARVEVAKANALGAIAASLCVGAVMVAVSIYLIGDYGMPLMVGTPFVMGLVVAVVVGEAARDWGYVVKLCLVTSVLALGFMVIFGLEGAICLVMAMPPMLVVTILGGLVGHTIVCSTTQTYRKTSLAFAILPMWLAADRLSDHRPVVRATTTIEIAAPIEAVWEKVIRFSEIPEPTEWFFRAGIAYPIRAEIRGEGVGAERHCIFTTGKFVEPITVWNAPTHLAFDVREQPDPMIELSPYRHVHPPHLDGGFKSLRGEFRLERIAADRTRLHGTTWYQIDIRPRQYWFLWTDWLIHAIHNRVLRHIRSECEGLPAKR